MSKDVVSLLIIIVFPVTLLGQLKLSDCKRIKHGTFYFYSPNTQKSVIIREGSNQKEINPQKGDTSFWKVTWQNACSYSLKFIRKSQPISDEEKSFYNSHISFVKILSITKDYYVFRGGLDSNNNKSALTDTLWRKARQSN